MEAWTTADLDGDNSATKRENNRLAGSTACDGRESGSGLFLVVAALVLVVAAATPVAVFAAAAAVVVTLAGAASFALALLTALALALVLGAGDLLRGIGRLLIWVQRGTEEPGGKRIGGGGKHGQGRR